ncbi:beta-ketoacyl synthase N-terminal-like domain-containing protein [Gilvimarinus chinensis]|uniref:beta-ketoacyl synthase N-terminal-like domain-containing protein n=1 Tax=Gilvimarinus chinensis TaxID=396005 RepID=UPI00038240B4|nr:beta-ketoacyl synthase N-terminal-like domain-containing protein [Gilvimarinus chinensis]
MPYLIDHYSLLHCIEPDTLNLPDLKPVIEKWHEKKIRRIDRYIQLCIAGGLNCVKSRALPHNTSLYLGTSKGAVATSARVMQTIESDRELPKPLHFVNTLGNSAGFYLTQLLNLTGTALVCSAEEHSFETALNHACLDLEAGQCETALVGCFDEAVLPLSHQHQRLGSPINRPALLEGTHWLLLSRSPDKALGKLSAPTFYTDLPALSDNGYSTQLSFFPTEKEQRLLSKSNHTVYDPVPHAAAHGSFSAAAFNHLLGQTKALHLSRSGSSYCAISWEAIPAKP